MSSKDLIVMGAECIHTGDRLVLKTNQDFIGEPFEIGTTWSVSGTESTQTLKRNDFQFQEKVIELTHAELILGTGEALIRLISESKRFPGIGRVKAQRLWNEFGSELFDIIESGDTKTLTRVLTLDVAEILCKGMTELGYVRALQNLMSSPLPSRACLDLIKAYGTDALELVKEDPYRLLCFLPEWGKVDKIAQNDFNIQRDDSKRLRAAVNEALISRFNLGNTAAQAGQVKTHVSKLLLDPALTDQAMELEGSKLYVKSENLIHAIGPWLMERTIASRIIDSRSVRELSTDDYKALSEAIYDYERRNRIALNQEQRSAIILSVEKPFSLILGGAGCGKTTVLKGVYEALHAAFNNLTIHQVALSGRAAQRMQESTGLEAQTIAAFLRNGDRVIERLTGNDVLVIDEASMLDVITSYWLFRRLPKKVKVILVGDPEQLPPVGPGLLLHVLAEIDFIPRTTLRVIKRQAEGSGIVAVASDIRNQKMPVFEYEDITFSECNIRYLTEAAVDAYFRHGGTGEDFSTVLVCPTKSGAGSTSQINAGIVARLKGDRQRVKTLWFSSDGILLVDHTINMVPLSVGDLVLITKNDYEIEVRNGSLGKVVGVPEAAPGDFNDVACYIEVDDVGLVEISVRKLDILQHGYAVTTHKAQGSQFPTVIFPVRKSKLLDKSLVYTAITRAQKECHILGDIVAFEHAVTNPPSAFSRNVGLMAAFDFLSESRTTESRSSATVLTC